MAKAGLENGEDFRKREKAIKKIERGDFGLKPEEVFEKAEKLSGCTTVFEGGEIKPSFSGVGYKVESSKFKHLMCPTGNLLRVRMERYFGVSPKRFERGSIGVVVEQIWGSSSSRIRGEREMKESDLTPEEKRELERMKLKYEERKARWKEIREEIRARPEAY